MWREAQIPAFAGIKIFITRFGSGSGSGTFGQGMVVVHFDTGAEGDYLARDVFLTRFTRTKNVT